jgi:hypothetical protein
VNAPSSELREWHERHLREIRRGAVRSAIKGMVVLALCMGCGAVIALWRREDPWQWSGVFANLFAAVQLGRITHTLRSREEKWRMHAFFSLCCVVVAFAQLLRAYR